MHGCKTERGQEAVLAHAQIADCTGVVEDVLVNAERLTALGGLTSETEVIAKALSLFAFVAPMTSAWAQPNS